MALHVKHWSKCKKGCETLTQLVNHEKITLVNSLWEHNFIQSCLQIIYSLFLHGKYSQCLQHQLMVDFQTSCPSAMESLCSFSKSTSPNFSPFSLACCHQSLSWATVMTVNLMEEGPYNCKSMHNFGTSNKHSFKKWIWPHMNIIKL